MTRTSLSAAAVASLLIASQWAALPAVASPVQPTSVSAHTAAQDAVGQPLMADFGLGKAAVTVEPEAGTFPADSTPDLTGLVVNFTDTTDPSITASCTLSSAVPGPASCQEQDNFLSGHVVSVELAPDQTLPTGFLAPAAKTLTIPQCADDQSGPPVCVGQVTLEMPGTWRPVGLIVANAATGKPVSGAHYTLCEPSGAASGRCPSGTAPAGTATSNASGTARFPGLFLGGPGYKVVATSVPSPYVVPGPKAFPVPAITTLADVGKPYTGHVTLRPRPITAKNDTARLHENATRAIDVLRNDTGPGTLTVKKLTRPAHGHAVVGPHGNVRYTPTNGFTGTDHFTYTAKNQYGATDNATVTVTVVQAAATQAASPTSPSGLPDTGAPTDGGALAAGGLLVAGGLVLVGRRRRTSRSGA